MRSAVSLNTRRSLGHPSVGGRLTAGAPGRSSQGTAVLNPRASVQLGCLLPVDGPLSVIRLERVSSPSLRGLAGPSKLTQ